MRRVLLPLAVGVMVLYHCSMVRPTEVVQLIKRDEFNLGGKWKLSSSHATIWPGITAEEWEWEAPDGRGTPISKMGFSSQPPRDEGIENPLLITLLGYRAWVWWAGTAAAVATWLLLWLFSRALAKRRARSGSKDYVPNYYRP